MAAENGDGCGTDSIPYQADKKKKAHSLPFSSHEKDFKEKKQ